MHDIFLRLWGRTGELQGNPAAFLSRAARNAAIDHLRRETVRRAWQAGAQPPLPSSDPAFALLSARQSAEAVRRGLKAMPETTRRLFLMSRAEGLSHQEIALRCGMSRRNVSKHVAKAVACCRRMLEQCGVGEARMEEAAASNYPVNAGHGHSCRYREPRPSA